MKHTKTVEALDRIFYLIGKQEISYRGTQETAAMFTIAKRLHLYKSNKSKQTDRYCCKIHQ